MHGAPTVIDYNLALNRFSRLKNSGHPAMQEFFNPSSSYLAIQTLCLSQLFKHLANVAYLYVLALSSLSSTEESRNNYIIQFGP